jgi:hypothetical protein
MEIDSLREEQQPAEGILLSDHGANDLSASTNMDAIDLTAQSHISLLRLSSTPRGRLEMALPRARS